ncbi:lysophosphatidylcholine acyltransferase isoform X2 [Diorhabda carinulata]|uniref:lysophosphatidylcholine acyltransferase isoform X2 n=1 Tax=Diorhabda carinulata TaxID=1163345 RepID=UPI0025A246BA|nr:lysophosphatidylcholine acyltransferase isoform X2 [Diorhabda carinulata]
MSVKYTGGISHEECPTEELLNPFVHRLELETTYEKIRTAILTVVLLPIRVSIICFFVIVGWIFAYIGLWGLSDEELRQKPLDGWRNSVRFVTARVMRSVFVIGGFHLKITGRQSNRASAPVVALAPHSSFIDSIAMVYMGGPSIVAKGETSALPFFGKLINFTQPVYVWRDDPNSRQNSIKEIINRATSDLDWPQILIFPEGTCTNRSCLITFKPGAFYPGVPIQPVCIRYPNKLDTVTWTWEGPSAWKLLWLTLTQPYSNCEIEFLPVYTPNEEEKRDSKLFARNVRAVMAKALGVPVIDYSYDDCLLMTRAKEMHLPYAPSLVEVNKLRDRLGLQNTKTEETLIDSDSICRDCSKISYVEFVKLLNIPSNSPASQQLFKIYDKENSGLIDFREYLLGVLGIEKDKNPLDVLRIACKIYDSSGHGRLVKEDFCKAACQTLALSKEHALEIFEQADRNRLGYITIENFINFAQKKAEFASFFDISSEEKKNSRMNGEILGPNYHTKKVD